MDHGALFVHRLRVVARAVAVLERRDVCLVEDTVEQFHTLIALRDVPGAPTTEIARRLGVGVGTASRNLDVLARHGLVSRERDARNGRRVVNALTRWGEVHVEWLTKSLADRLGIVYWKLGAPERVAVVDALGLLGDLLAPHEMDDAAAD